MKALIIDNGDYTFLAEQLGKECDVGYFSPWVNAAPVSRMVYPGRGLKGVTRVDEPLAYILNEKPDLVIFPHLYHTDLERAVRELDIPCFGPAGGARLENDRWFLKEFLSEHDLSLGMAYEMVGIEELRQFLSDPKNEDKYIKVSIFRGDMNTYHHETWKKTSVSAWWLDLTRMAGPIGQEMRFIVEDPIPTTLELSIEGFWVDGEMLEPFMVGLEIKDAGEFGFYCDRASKLPKPIRNILAALSGYFGKEQYRSFFALEIRIAENGDAFLTDVTCRLPVPPGAAICGSTKNLLEVFTQGGAGKAIKPEVAGKFLTEIKLKSHRVVKDFLLIEYPKAIATNIALFSHCMIGSDYWVIPHVPEDEESDDFGSVFACAGSPEECEAQCKKAVEKVQADQLFYKSDVLTEAQDLMAKAAEYGVTP